jgi:hypothetical protein
LLDWIPALDKTWTLQKHRSAFLAVWNGLEGQGILEFAGDQPMLMCQLMLASLPLCVWNELKLTEANGVHSNWLALEHQMDQREQACISAFADWLSKGSPDSGGVKRARIGSGPDARAAVSVKQDYQGAKAQVAKGSPPASTSGAKPAGAGAGDGCGICKGSHHIQACPFLHTNVNNRCAGYSVDLRTKVRSDLGKYVKGNNLTPAFTSAGGVTGLAPSSAPARKA